MSYQQVAKYLDQWKWEKSGYSRSDISGDIKNLSTVEKSIRSKKLNTTNSKKSDLIKTKSLDFTKTNSSRTNLPFPKQKKLLYNYKNHLLNYQFLYIIWSEMSYLYKKWCFRIYH